ncbi:MAG: 30S ribosomal protein S17 [Planctomycetota bacterium]
MRAKRKTLVGTVRSDRMRKTITVEIESRVQHALYGKYILRRRRFAAHDEKEEAGVGDRVEIMSSRPLSKRKHWRLVRVLERSRRPGERAP